MTVWGCVCRCLGSLTRLRLNNAIVHLPALMPITQQLVSLDLQGSVLLSEKTNKELTTDVFQGMDRLEGLSLRDASCHAGNFEVSLPSLRRHSLTSASCMSTLSTPRNLLRAVQSAPPSR
jgi:hypothetical protein